MLAVRLCKVQVVAALLAGLLGGGFAYAEKPDHAGGSGKGGKHERPEKGQGGKGGGQQRGERDDRGPADRDGRDSVVRSRDDGARRHVVTRFETRERTVIWEYFAREGGGGQMSSGAREERKWLLAPGPREEMGGWSDVATGCRVLRSSAGARR